VNTVIKKKELSFIKKKIDNGHESNLNVFSEEILSSLNSWRTQDLLYSRRFIIVSNNKESNEL